MAHNTAVKIGTGLTSEEQKNLIKILNNPDIKKIIKDKKKDEVE